MKVLFLLGVAFSVVTGAADSARCSAVDGAICHDYCIIGAGPAGLQLSYLMNEKQRDYVILDRGFIPANFYKTMPRHRSLISINKRWTGREMETEGGKEYNMRHDWHSLLTKHDELQMRHFSDQFFPTADEYLQYAKRFQEVVKPNIKYGRNVKTVVNGVDDSYLVTAAVSANEAEAEDSTIKHPEEKYSCQYLVIATGLFTEFVPDIPGIKEHSESYITFDTNPKKYANKTVAILGGGNAAYEVFKDIMGETAYVHMHGTSSGLKMAWETHYVGNLRSINAIPLDNYQLKSQDIVDTTTYTELVDGKAQATFQEKIRDGVKKHCIVPDAEPGDLEEDSKDQKQAWEDAHKVKLPWPRLEWDGESVVPYLTPDELNATQLDACYDYIIRCTGLLFDNAPFSQLSPAINTTMGPTGKKYPDIDAKYRVKGHKNLYTAGTLSHRLDYKKSSGGFIHGFRYTAVALHHILERENHNTPWPSKSLRFNSLPAEGDSRQSLRERIQFRADTSSSMYQMFRYFGDVGVVRSRDGSGSVDYYEDVPLMLARELADGHDYFTLTQDYGPDFHGHKRVFSNRRIKHDNNPLKSHRSQFLHPIVRFYNFNKTATKQFRDPTNPDTFLKYKRAPFEHHMIESPVTDFKNHIMMTRPLQAFIQRIYHAKDLGQPDDPHNTEWNDHVKGLDNDGHLWLKFNKQLLTGMSYDFLESKRKILQQWKQEYNDLYGVVEDESKSGESTEEEEGFPNNEKEEKEEEEEKEQKPANTA